MKRAKRERPLDRYPYPRIGVSYFAEQAYCEKRVELWLENPGNLVSVPAAIQRSAPDAESQEQLAATGKEVHESLATGALPVSEAEVEGALQSGQSFTLVESSFLGEYEGLPLIGQPDVVCFDARQASFVLEYKITDSDQLQMSHRTQLLLYGYLLAEQGFRVDNLILVCCLIPPRHDTWIAKLKRAIRERLVCSVCSEAERLVASQPTRQNWHHMDFKVSSGVNVGLRVFKYSQQRAESELAFFARYWLGERDAMPTKKPNKCAVCLYNRQGLCSVAQAPYSG